MGSAKGGMELSEHASTDRRTGLAPSTTPGHQVNGSGTLTEILNKIASAMPCDPDHSLARVWGAAQASRALNRLS